MASNPQDGRRRRRRGRSYDLTEIARHQFKKKCAKLNGVKKIHIYIYDWRLGLS